MQCHACQFDQCSVAHRIRRRLLLTPLEQRVAFRASDLLGEDRERVALDALRSLTREEGLLLGRFLLFTAKKKYMCILDINSTFVFALWCKKFARNIKFVRDKC